VSRGLRVAVLGCLVAGCTILFASGRDWEVRTDAAHRSVGYSGHALVKSLTVWGLVAVAGVVAIAATRRWGRVPVGLALAACGVAVVVLCLGMLGDVHSLSSRTFGPPRGLPDGLVVRDRATAWPYVTIGAGVVLALSGLLVAVRGPRWAGLGARYDVPADRPRTDADLWAAQDRGEDPTAS
jgi:hypothetical protein